MADAAKTKIATMLFKSGSEAVTKGNFEFAVDSFLKCTKLVPDHLVYRQALRGAERKMYKDNKKGAMMAGARMATSKLSLKAAKARKKWHDVIEAAEEALRFNPWEASMMYEIGLACRELEYIDTGIWVLETAADADKTTADIYRLLAVMYEADNQYDKAINALAMVKKIDPADHDSAAKMRQLAASSTIQKGKYENAESFRDSVQKDDSAPEGVIETAGVDTHENRARREVAALEAKLESDPGNANLCVQIGDAYRRLMDWDKAIMLYKQALHATGGADQDIKIKMLDTQIEPFRRKLEMIKDNLAALEKNPAKTPEGVEKLNKLQMEQKAFKSEIIKRETELFRFKVEINPADYGSHYELGYRHLQLKQFDEAIKALQQGRNDARHRWEALCYLGVAFWQKKNYALAEKNLSDAVAAVPEGDEDAQKKVVYYRARVAEDRKDLPAAIGLYNEIAAIDYGYLDVATRLDKLNAEQPS